jgi:transcriptional regulator with XRE-family HTH domain
MAIGDRIKARREELGWTQEELAMKMGYKSKSTINKVEMGKVDVSQKKIPQYAKVLMTTEKYLMGWDDAVPTSEHQTGYYSPETAKAAQEMLDDPDLHALMDAARDARPEYVKSAIQLLKTLKETNPDG